MCCVLFLKPRCVELFSDAASQAFVALRCVARPNLIVPAGSCHRRLKAPIGRRLAAPLIALAYGGNGNVQALASIKTSGVRRLPNLHCYVSTGTITGPTISGCVLDDTTNTITLRFNKSLLSGDSVAITRTQVPISPPPAPDPEEKHPPKWTGALNSDLCCFAHKVYS